MRLKQPVCHRLFDRFELDAARGRSSGDEIVGITPRFLGTDEEGGFKAARLHKREFEKGLADMKAIVEGKKVAA